MKNTKNGKLKSPRLIRPIANGKGLSFARSIINGNLVVPVMILVGMAIILLFSRWFFYESRTGFALNAPSPRTYHAITAVTYQDRMATENIKEKAANRQVTVVVSEVIEEDQLEIYLTDLSRERFDKLPLPEDLQNLLLQLNETEISIIARVCGEIGNSIRSSGFLGTANRTEMSSYIWEQLETRALTRAQKNLAYQIIDRILRPSESVDPDLTAELTSRLMSDIQPVERSLQPGDLIINRGETITPDIALVLKDQGYPEKKFPFNQLFLVIIGVVLWMVWFHRKIAQERYSLSGKQPWIYVVVLQAIAWVALYFSHLAGAEGTGIVVLSGWAYLTMSRPVAFQVILAASLIGAFLVAGASSGLVLVSGIMGFVAAMSGYFFFKTVRSRTQLWKELFMLGLYLSITGIIVRWSLGMTFNWRTILVYAGASMVWSIITLLTLPLLETVFDVLSPLRLMDLSHPSQNLLKKLQIEAPGTYHHSLMVGTLAEAAAEKLGLDSNLVKAGAYYHDIGKLKRPHYYVENLMGTENVHNRIAPSLSALSIIAHVREGTEIAREYKLPRRIIDFIAEHHGKTCLSYFYRKARNLGEEVSRDQFCYPGPKPSSKETALLMIVDSVEAAVRADIENINSMQDLEKVISGVIESKVVEGQMENVDFTLKELSEMKEVLLSTLQSMYHTRRVQKIPSPKEAEAEKEENR